MSHSPYKSGAELSLTSARVQKDDDFHLADLLAASSSDASHSSPYESNLADEPPSPSGSSSSSSSTASASSATSTDTPNISASPPSEDCDTSDLPDVPLLRLLRKDDHPHHIKPPARIPQNTHPGNDGLTPPTDTLAKSRIRTYHTPCSTFLDLVDDPLPTDWQGRQRLRLRAGSRTLGPPLLHTHGLKQGLLRPPSSDLKTALTEMYRIPEITYWPSAQNPNPNLANEHVDAIYKLMNPPSHLGNVEGTADERSIVYVTGERDSPQAIIFIAFDPAIKLVGLKQWGVLCQKRVGEGQRTDGRAAGHSVEEMGSRGKTYVDVEERDTTVTVERKGKGNERVRYSEAPIIHSASGGSVTVDVHDGGAFTGCKVGVGLGRDSWAWKEKAMYQAINIGFHFGLERDC